MLRIVLVAVALSSCAATDLPGCTDLAAAGINVQVISSPSGEPLCDATVVAEDGAFKETLQANGCRYFGVFERAGTYKITASHPDHDRVVENGVVVTKDECHVVGVTRKITLAHK